VKGGRGSIAEGYNVEILHRLIRGKMSAGGSKGARDESVPNFRPDGNRHYALFREGFAAWKKGEMQKSMVTERRVSRGRVLLSRT